MKKMSFFNEENISFYINKKMKELNGNYIKYGENSVNYNKEDNYYGTPPFTYDNNITCVKTKEENSEILMSTDNNMAIGGGTMYQTGPMPCKNCPFYNYLLPYNFPYVETESTPDPRYYWYFPYYKDTTFYSNPYSSAVPKSYS